MAETVDLLDNRLPMILCSEQFGIVAKDPDCNSGLGIEPTSDVWAVRRKYLSEERWSLLHDRRALGQPLLGSLTAVQKQSI
jgi:hypothetical protein